MIDLEKQIYTLINKMPSLPPTVMKVVSIANDINATAKDLVTVIKMDPVLAAKVLKLINSSYFGLSNDVTSLNRAVILLGMNTVKNLALSTAVVGSLERPKNAGADLDAIWRHSLACAVGAKLVANEARVPKQILEEFFIAGLLHDIGIIFLAGYLPEEYAEHLAGRTPEQTFRSAETMQFQMDHAELGVMIAEHWNLPTNLTEAIRFHHEPKPGSESEKEVAAVHLADRHACRLGYLYPGEEEHAARPEALAILGLTAEQVEGALQPLGEEIQKASVFLQT